VLHDRVDHTGAVEASHHRHPARHRGGLEPPDFLHPSHVALDLRPLHRQRVEILVGAPGKEQPQVRLGVQPRDAGVRPKFAATANRKTRSSSSCEEVNASGVVDMATTVSQAPTANSSITHVAAEECGFCVHSSSSRSPAVSRICLSVSRFAATADLTREAANGATNHSGPEGRRFMVLVSAVPFPAGASR
jgi:hypothetical protein